MEALGTFVANLVIFLLFAAGVWLAYKVSGWVFRRSLENEMKKSEQISEEERLRAEKEAIARRLIDEQKHKELEEQVRRELIEKGQLPPEDK